jgi:hypothetical protein
VSALGSQILGIYYMPLIRVAQCIYRAKCRIGAVLLLKYIFGVFPVLYNFKRCFVVTLAGRDVRQEAVETWTNLYNEVC